MRTIFLLLVFVAGIMSGCEKKIEYDCKVWVNEEAEVCGVKNPVENIDWLKKKNDYQKGRALDTDDKAPYFGEIGIFKHNETEELVIVTYSNGYTYFYICDGTSPYEGGKGGTSFSNLEIYNEANSPEVPTNNLSETYSMPPKPCFDCKEFFQTHTYVEHLAKNTRTIKTQEEL